MVSEQLSKEVFIVKIGLRARLGLCVFKGCSNDVVFEISTTEVKDIFDLRIRQISRLGRVLVEHFRNEFVDCFQVCQQLSNFSDFKFVTWLS